MSNTDYSNNLEKSISIIGFDENYKQRDTLALLSIKILSRLDTFYQWHNLSDCLPCGWLQYRFADSKYETFPESGFFWINQPDSVYQLTIRHKPKRWTADNIDLKPLSLKDSGMFFNYWFANELYCKDVKYKEKAFLRINDRNFYVLQFTSSCGYVTDSPSLFVAAVTNLKNRQLEVIAEYSGKDTAGFFELMRKSILSIRIKENP